MQFAIHVSQVSGDAQVGVVVRGRGPMLFSLSCRPLWTPPSLRPLQSEPLGGLVCLKAGVLQQWLRVSVDIGVAQATAVLSTRRFRWMTVVLEGMEVLPLSADQWSQWNRMRKHL